MKLSDHFTILAWKADGEKTKTLARFKYWLIVASCSIAGGLLKLKVLFFHWPKIIRGLIEFFFFFLNFYQLLTNSRPSSCWGINEKFYSPNQSYGFIKPYNYYTQLCVWAQPPSKLGGLKEIMYVECTFAPHLPFGITNTGRTRKKYLNTEDKFVMKLGGEGGGTEKKERMNERMNEWTAKKGAAECIYTAFIKKTQHQLQ